MLQKQKPLLAGPHNDDYHLLESLLCPRNMETPNPKHHLIDLPLHCPHPPHLSGCLAALLHSPSKSKGGSGRPIKKLNPYGFIRIM